MVLLPDGAAKYLSKSSTTSGCAKTAFWKIAVRASAIVAICCSASAQRTVITAQGSDRVRDVIALLKDNGISQMPVLEGRRVVRASSPRSALLRYLASGEDSLSSTDRRRWPKATTRRCLRRRASSWCRASWSDARMAIVRDDKLILAVITKIDLIEYLAKKHGTPVGVTAASI